MKKIRYVLTLALLLLLTFALCGCKEEKKASAQPQIKVYWNVERDSYYDYELQQSIRMKAGDNYRVRFACDGEQVDLFVPTATMMNSIDSMKFMGLAVDENNVVTQVYKPHQFCGGVAAYEYYVISIEGEKVLCNNMANGRGLPLKLKINENTGVYNVSGGGLLAGLSCELKVGDQIYAVMGNDGYVSHIYVMPPFQSQPIYWNLNRQWDSTSRTSTRTRGDGGYFYIDFLMDGQPVTLRTTSVEVIDQIDSFGARCMNLEVDENGVILSAKHAKYSTGGATIASWYHVLRLDKAGASDDINIVADGFYAEKFSGNDKGSTAQCTYADNCVIYDVSDSAPIPGMRTELKVGDQIHGLTNPDGDVAVIFVVNRPRELQLYYNMERKWNSTTKASTRTKSGDGYYHIQMSLGGKLLNLKTQDADIVKTIDSRAAKVLGLELDGNIITGAYAPGGVRNSQKTVFDYSDVTQIAPDGTITTARNGIYYTGKPVEGCKVWNVSSTATTKGEKTSVRVGDKLYAMGDLFGNIHHIYVVGRTINSPLYWNLDRSYDSVTKTTKRVPAEDGYYYIKLSKGTQTVTFKTKSKALVNKLDSFVAVALTARGDEITAVYKYDCAKGYTGGGFASWAVVRSVKGRTITAADGKGSYTGTMSSGCPVYLVSGGSAVPVTKTSLQVGDRIHGVKDSNGNIVVVFVVNRPIRTELYYNLDRQWDPETATTKRVPDSEGWYWFDMAVNATHVKLKTDSLELANIIDERAARVLGLELQDDKILAVHKPGNVEGSKQTVFDFAVITEIADGKITATRNDKTFTGTLSATAKAFDVSADATLMGELTTLRVGDTVYGLGDSSKAVNFLFVTKRAPQQKIAPCAACGTEVTWHQWNGTDALKEGHWYLTKDVTVTACQNLAGEKTFCLDLCGFTAAGKEGLDRMINVYGTLNIMDSGENGQLVSHYSGDAGRTGLVCYVQNSAANGSGTLNLYSGTLTATGTTAKGGILGVASVFHMYGGKLEGGTAQQGGCLFVEKTSAAEVSLLGGTIVSGTAQQGGDVYSRMDLTLGGDVTIGDLYLETDRKLLLQQLGEQVSVGVTLQSVYGTVATGAVEADLQRIHVAQDLALEYADGVLSIPVPVQPHQDHCVCGGLGQVGDHICMENAPQWQPWTGQWTDGGYYYLTEDFQVTSTILVEEGKSLHICLNGHKMVGADGVNRVLNVYGALDICDHKDDQGQYAGQISCNYDPAKADIKTGGVFYVQNRTGAVLNLFGGELKLTTKLKNGGVGGITGGFNLYDGKLTGTTVSGDGGVLYLESANAHVQLFGGTVSGGRATNGGNIYLKSGKLTIDGGNVEGGYASNAGGSIRVQAGATLELKSGKISGGEAKGNGGNIYSLGNVVITGGTVENGHVASGKIGGNVYASGGTLSVENATVSGGSAATGGNLAIKVDGVTLADSLICGGTGDTGKDIYFEKENGTLSVTGCGPVEVYAKAGTVSGDENVTIIP